MPRVLTTNAVVTCPHGGVGTSVAATPLWEAAGGTVLQEGDVGTLTCVFLPPCGGYVLASMGLNATTVAGRRVVLETDFQRSATGMPLLVVEAHPVFDDSTPAPLPPPVPGVPPPPLAPELLDAVRPTVTATPTSVVFKKTPPPPVPPGVAFGFAFAGPFPGRWELTWQNPETGESIPLTTDPPPGITVTPTGGAWDGSPGAVAVTVAASVLQLLPPNPGHPQQFVLTAISPRGLWGSATVSVEVQA